MNPCTFEVSHCRSLLRLAGEPIMSSQIVCVLSFSGYGLFSADEILLCWPRDNESVQTVMFGELADRASGLEVGKLSKLSARRPVCQTVSPAMFGQPNMAGRHDCLQPVSLCWKTTFPCNQRVTCHLPCSLSAPDGLAPDVFANRY